MSLSVAEDDSDTILHVLASNATRHVNRVHPATQPRKRRRVGQLSGDIIGENVLVAICIDVDSFDASALLSHKTPSSLSRWLHSYRNSIGLQSGKLGRAQSVGSGCLLLGFAVCASYLMIPCDGSLEALPGGWPDGWEMDFGMLAEAHALRVPIGNRKRGSSKPTNQLRGSPMFDCLCNARTSTMS